MKPDSDKQMNELLNALRKSKGYCPPTPEEAEAAFDDAAEEPLSPDEVSRIVQAATSGESVSWMPVPSLDWLEGMDLDEADCQQLQLHRSKGEEDDEAIANEDDVRKELLDNGDDSEEEDGVA